MREETENAFQDLHSLQIPELNIKVQKASNVSAPLF